jgi:cytochrome c oxidase subunit 1
MGWDTLNAVSTLGAFVTGLAFLMFVANALLSYRSGRAAGANPWDASSLEWATSSPPPVYNFRHVPVVASRTPLWDDRAHLTVMTGLRVAEREHLLTTVIEARPDLREPSPKPTSWPLVAALAVTGLFVGSIFTPWAVVWGALPVAVALTAWFWPARLEPDPEPVIE